MATSSLRTNDRYFGTYPCVRVANFNLGIAAVVSDELIIKHCLSTFTPEINPLVHVETQLKLLTQLEINICIMIAGHRNNNMTISKF